MNILLENWQLDATRLPENWQAEIAARAVARAGIAPEHLISSRIISCSTDSRGRIPKLVLNVLLETTAANSKAGRPLSDAEAAALALPDLPIPDGGTLRNPLVIGTGPAGISAALVLAYAGCEPVIIDRGSPVGARSEAHRNFLQSRQLDENNNLLIGEGGAGTFSDGKLYTGTRDINAMFLKKLWVECGAPEEIIWRSRAHIGSDHLPIVAGNLRRKIESHGGKFLFNTEISDLLIRNGSCCGAITSSGEILEAPAVIFAPGLGGRELVRRVCRHAEWELKLFQSGCRIEHPQTLIDRAMYHLTPRPQALGAAEYHIVSRKGKLPVSSFCMCPGGTLVNATAWENHSISNGMSCFARNGKFANSCLIATFNPTAWGTPEQLFAAFDTLEKKIFDAGGGDYTLPAQDASSFCRQTAGLKSCESGCETGIIPGRLDQLLMKPLQETLTAAILDFERRIPGFARNGKLVGAESFVSSPIRLCRDRVTFQNPALPGLYPAGEGCGLAGGIVSAGCDGIRCALALLTENSAR